MTTRHAIDISSGSWTAFAEAASLIRRRVFIEEQAVPEEEEWDGLDPDCVHFLAYRDDHAIGTARLLADGHIGRVAVLPEGRGLGIGLLLMQAAVDAAQQAGHTAVMLDAQLQAIPFYQRLGFRAFGSEFLDAGILHRRMRLETQLHRHR